MFQLLGEPNALVEAALNRAFPEMAAAARQAGQPLDPQPSPHRKWSSAISRPLRQSPRQIATAIVEQWQVNPAFAVLCLPPEIAGLGFINLSLRAEVLALVVDFSRGQRRQ